MLEDTEALDADLAECANSREEIEQGWAFLSYANGLMTAAAAGPEFIPPAEWLSEVFDPADADMSDEDTRLANETMESGYRRIVESLNEPDSAYEPFFWTDGEGRLITRDWAEGFFPAFACARSSGLASKRAMALSFSPCWPPFSRTKTSMPRSRRTASIRKNSSAWPGNRFPI